MNYIADEKYVRVIGRTLFKNNIRYLNYSCSAVEFTFTGLKAEAVLWTNSPSLSWESEAWVAVFINDEVVPSKRFALKQEEATYLLYEGTTQEEVTLRLVKYSEAAHGKVGIKSILLDGEAVPKPTQAKNRKLEFIGDSITCGFGIEGVFEKDAFRTDQENPWEAYAATTARALEAEYHLISWSGIGIISNYTEQDVPNDEWLMPPLYPYTDKSMDLLLGNNPEPWDFDQYQPDCIVVNLGTNDTSYTKGIAERVEAFGNRYYDFMQQVRKVNPNAVILCTLGVMGQDLCGEISRQVERMNLEGDQNIFFLPFEVQKEEDGIATYWHPNITTNKKMAVKLEGKIREIMNW